MRNKTLNVPYDCGLAIVRDPAALRSAMSMHGDYLIATPAIRSRRSPSCPAAAALPVWAVLRSLGRSGSLSS